MMERKRKMITAINSDEFDFTTVASLEEPFYSDLIYVSDKLSVGTPLHLKYEGTNIKGDLRYKVSYGSFSLGYITLSSFLSSFYEGCGELWGEILTIRKRKYLPASEIDIKLQTARLRKVS